MFNGKLRCCLLDLIKLIGWQHLLCSFRGDEAAGLATALIVTIFIGCCVVGNVICGRDSLCGRDRFCGGQCEVRMIIASKNNIQMKSVSIRTCQTITTVESLYLHSLHELQRWLLFLGYFDAVQSHSIFFVLLLLHMKTWDESQSNSPQHALLLTFCKHTVPINSKHYCADKAALS